MNRKIIPKLISGFSFLIVAILWLVSTLKPNSLGGFNLAWGVVVFAGMNGIAFVINAVLARNSIVDKRLYLIVASIMFVIVAVSIVFALALPTEIIWPIIAVVLAPLLIVGTLITNGKKWDAGDNQKAGYKTYKERKEEENKEKKVKAT